MMHFSWVFFFTSSLKAGYYNYKRRRYKLIHGKLQVKLKALQCDTSSFFIVQDDGVTAVPVFAYIGTAPVFDDGGCTDIVSATANL